MRISGPAAMIAALLLGTAASARADVAQANVALLHGRVDEATKLLQPVLATNPNDAMAHQILCRIALVQDQADPAVDECRKAVAANPASSENQLWFGRALGLKTSHAFITSQTGLARQVCAAFEKAVQLDPANIHAASDLGEFYIHAPGFVGGGTDKAQRLAAAVQAYSPSRGHRMLAQLAQKNGDNTTAEAEFQQAIGAEKSAEAYIDLAIFYQQTKQKDKILPAISKALSADRNHGPAEVDAASILTKANLAPQVAEKALRDYLRSDAQTDETPAFKVHVQLGNMLAKNKDKEGARREYMAALDLAANYAPARKALQNL